MGVILGLSLSLSHTHTHTHTHTLREENILRVFGVRVLRIIFGPKREEVAGSWRRLHNEELHNLYASLNINMVIK
jgi:hypothetical protein